MRVGVHLSVCVRVGHVRACQIYGVDEDGVEACPSLRVHVLDHVIPYLYHFPKLCLPCHSRLLFRHGVPQAALRTDLAL